MFSRWLFTLVIIGDSISSLTCDPQGFGLFVIRCQSRVAICKRGEGPHHIQQTNCVEEGFLTACSLYDKVLLLHSYFSIRTLSFSLFKNNIYVITLMLKPFKGLNIHIITYSDQQFFCSACTHALRYTQRDYTLSRTHTGKLQTELFSHTICTHCVFLT